MLILNEKKDYYKSNKQINEVAKCASKKTGDKPYE
jgi:hypothetical protein